VIVTAGAVDVTTYFHLRLAASGLDATGLTISDIDLQYVRSGVAPVAKVDAVALAATDTAHTDNRGIEIDATDQPGVYRIDWPDAAFAAGVREVILTVKVATAFTESLRVELVSDLAAAIDTIDNFLDTEIAAILSAVDTVDNFLDTEVAAILAAVDTEVAAIKAVTDVFVAAQAEPTTVPAVNETPMVKLAYLFQALRNGFAITSAKKQYLDDAGAALWEKDVADNGTTYTETKGNAP
jgi:hypothetical protein